MIKPTIGRIVLIFGRPNAANPHHPERADICFVHNDKYINVSGNDANGEPFKATSVYLWQEGDNPAPNGMMWAEWMPYQKAVAAGSIPPTLHAAPAENTGSAP